MSREGERPVKGMQVNRITKNAREKERVRDERKDKKKSCGCKAKK